MYVSERDHCSALELLGSAATARSRQTFASIALPAAVALFRATEASYAEILTPSWRFQYFDGYPTPPRALPGPAQTLRERPSAHPWLARWLRLGATGAVRLSDLCPGRELGRSAYWATFYQPRGLRHAEYLDIARSTSGVTGLSVGRERRDFSAAELDLAEHVRVPLGRVWSQVAMIEALRKASSDVRPILAPGLTPAETRVASMVMQGLDNRTIAVELDLSVKSVEQYLTRVYRKVGVRSRTQLVLRVVGSR